MRNKVLFIVLMVIFVLSVTAVSAQGSITPDDVVIPDALSEGINIVYWHEWDGAQKEAIDQIIAAFNENNEYGISVSTVELGSVGPMREAVSAGIVSGELPNLVGGFANDAQSWWLDGVVVPLDPYINHETWGFSEEQQANLNLTVINANRIEGEPFNDVLLAWSIGFSGVTLSVNIGMLEALGFDGPPETLEQFREVACAAAEYTGPAGEDVQGFPIRTNPQDMHAFILSQGGSIWDEEAQQFDFTNDTVISTLEFFQQLVADGCAYIPETNFSNTADFAASLNPMAVGSTVGVPFIQRDANAANQSGGTGVSNWVNTTTPWSEGNRTLVLNFRSVILMASTPEQQLATWLFLKHMASDEMQAIWTSTTLYQPYTVSGLENLSETWLDENPQFQNIRELLQDESVRTYGEPQLIGYFDATREFGNLIAAALTNPDLDIAAAAATAEAAANSILNDLQSALD
jgi:multiple sugar transport system substrate-binding protein